MDEEKISELAEEIARKECVLFAGSGLTLKGGGMTWDQLVEFLKDKFEYDSPLTDNKEIMDDIVQKNNKKTVYGEIRKKLDDVEIPESISPLTGLPWFSVFTTNYDLALENTLKENQSLNVKTVLTGREFELTGIQSEILCVKLMGSLDKNYNDEGSMVLTQGEYSKARERRSRIFDLLQSHAANLSFLFVGYSFEDDIFIEMLNRLIEDLGKPDNTYYALFKDEPNEKKAYRLKQLNVKTIIGDIEDFTERLCEKVSQRDPNDFSTKKVRVGSNIIPIEPSQLRSFLNLYTPLLYSDWDREINPKDFLKGKTDSFKPFDLGWEFEREEINEVVSTVRKLMESDSSNDIISITGDLGSGRTITMLSSICKLIKEDRALAVKIPKNLPNKIPDEDEIEDFYEHICNSAEDMEVDPPEIIIIWAEYPLKDDHLIRFENEFKNFSENIVLLYEDIPLDTREDVKEIELKTNLSQKKKEALGDYILDYVKKHRLPRIKKGEVETILSEEEKFLGIMYRSLDPARRSINEIVKDEIYNIEKKEVKKTITYCALSNYLGLDTPVPIIRKTLSKDMGERFTYPDVFNILEEEGKKLLKKTTDKRKNPYFSIYHEKLASYIVSLMGTNKMDETLSIFSESCNVKSRFEAEFISNLFIREGVNRVENHKEIPFTVEGLERALTELIERQPARPLLHHLARLKIIRDIDDEDIINLLNQALRVEKDSYAMRENRENILTTLAGVKWERNKEDLIEKSNNHPDVKEILSLLIEARKNVDNPHAYHRHATILKEISENKEEEKRIQLISEAIDVLNRGIINCDNSTQEKQYLEETLLEYLTEIDFEEAKKEAKRLLEEENNGAGYYILSRIKYHKERNKAKAKVFLDKALDGENYPPETLALKIKLLLKDNDYPNYEKILEYVEELESKFDYDDSWESAYYKAVVYTINGYYKKAKRLFNKAHRLSPKNLQRTVKLFWMEQGSRKIFEGKVGNQLERYTGWIYSHDIEGWDEDIFFNPSQQDEKNNIQSGYFVRFELGFSPKGPIAFEVRPTRDPDSYN